MLKVQVYLIVYQEYNLRTFFRTQFDVSAQRFFTENDVNMESEISLRTAATKHSIGSGQGFLKCSCTTSCKTNKCLCKKKNVLCNSKCHSSLSCNNK